MKNTSIYPWEFTGKFTGKGKVVVDGKEREAELTFTGKFKEQNNEKRNITFDLFEVGEDKTWMDISLVNMMDDGAITTKQNDSIQFPFVVNGLGKILDDGKERNAEFNFIGVYKDINREEKTITFDLVPYEEGGDKTFSEVVFH